MPIILTSVGHLDGTDDVRLAKCADVTPLGSSPVALQGSNIVETVTARVVMGFCADCEHTTTVVVIENHFNQDRKDVCGYCFGTWAWETVGE